MTATLKSAMSLALQLPSSPGVRFAEAVLPGHPDKLADQIADGIVDIALAKESRAIVQVEVAVHEYRCHINGRVSNAGGALDRACIEATCEASTNAWALACRLMALATAAIMHAHVRRR